MDISNFKLVQYKKLEYPKGLVPVLKEVPGHFDKSYIKEKGEYSLHTEYSFTSRKLNSDIITKYIHLKESNKKWVPQLWKSNEWASEFADFIFEITSLCEAPKVIEIHPPFKEYCNLNEFVERYSIFESKILEKYTDTKIVIENRAGSRYSGSNFLFSKTDDIIELCNTIKDNKLNLKVVLDFPQLLTAEHIDTLNFDMIKYHQCIDKLCNYSIYIAGIHIWGKKPGKNGTLTSHVGNLNTYFGDNILAKNEFIKGISKVCNDGIQRYLVPEVNSGNDDLESLMSDLF